MNIEQIKEACIYGNHYHDSDLWKECERFALDANNSLTDRVVAIRKIDEIMGEPKSEGADQEIIDTFIQQLQS